MDVSPEAPGEALRAAASTALAASSRAPWPRTPDQRGPAAPPDHAAPCPRDRAAMAAVGPSLLLVYGGADAGNKRLDDAWLFDLGT